MLIDGKACSLSVDLEFVAGNRGAAGCTGFSAGRSPSVVSRPPESVHPMML
jgi:hypothetical protein